MKVFTRSPGEGDICIRIGATARLDGGVNADGNGGPFIGSGADSRNNRIDTRDFLFQGRGTLWFDARQMTQYGVLKAYFSGGFDASTGSSVTGTAFWKRGYIGFAGATIGKTQSFFDFLNGSFSYGAYHLGGGSNTYDSGTLLAAYTAEFGLGISATLSVEDSSTRRNALWDAGTNALSIGSFPGPNGTSVIGSTICNSQTVTPDGPPGVSGITGCPTGDYAANQIPDVVGNLRIDQGWGSAQIAGAVHQVRAGSYGDNVAPLIPNVGPGAFTGQAPADKWGFALMGGAMANVPTGEGDKLWANVVYAQGATAYTGLSQFGSFGTFSRFNGGSVGAAWALDGVFANTVGNGATGLSPSGIQLTKAWSVGAAFEHHWNPSVRSSVFGVVTQVSYPGDLTSGAKAIFCSSPVGPVRNAAGVAPSFGAPVAGCNPDFMVWGVGTRTVWDPVRNLDTGRRNHVFAARPEHGAWRAAELRRRRRHTRRKLHPAEPEHLERPVARAMALRGTADRGSAFLRLKSGAGSGLLRDSLGWPARCGGRARFGIRCIPDFSQQAQDFEKIGAALPLRDL